KHGTVVALTNTLLSRFGSKVTSPSLGMLMNNGVMWFDPAPGHPNSIIPGVRPLANMCPLVAADGKGKRYAMGGAGGRTIFPTLLQIISYVFDFGMSLEEAFLEPRLDASTDTIRIPSRAGQSVAEAVAGEFNVEIVEDGIYPVRFSLPSAVCRDTASGLNIGMAHHNSPCPAAVEEPLP
ncbi:MAG: gamma-glutamyltransferase, partial [Mailhella sp.]|nr:gamma-glutamyltransferase [Mailhella sp.]